ncbi:MAG: GNAT family N-acetyltransferase [Flavobacteriaceae bacterium]|nr:GNAT family N-acetyltransferase [Flavobacteriaceae bacterium]
MDLAVKKYTRFPANSLIEHINLFERVLKSGEFLQTIIHTLEKENKISIVEYRPKYARAFYELNIEWLETFFYVEEYDREVLSNAEKYILGPGGHIFFAVENDRALGTVALMKEEDGVFELTKMAVRPDQRGKQIGQKLMQHCLDFARREQFDKLFLYSNRKLENAIHIYRKFGFMEVKQESEVPYKRSNIKMELEL